MNDYHCNLSQKTISKGECRIFYNAAGQTHNVTKTARCHKQRKYSCTCRPKYTLEEKDCDQLTRISNFFSWDGSNVCNIYKQKQNRDQEKGDNSSFADSLDRILASNFSKNVESIIVPNKGVIWFDLSSKDELSEIKT